MKSKLGFSKGNLSRIFALLTATIGMDDILAAIIPSTKENPLHIIYVPAPCLESLPSE